MEIKELNALQLGAFLQANFEAYWKQANVPVTISSTWAQDLGIALWFQKHTDDKRAIQETIEEGYEAWKTDFDMSSQLIMAANYLSSFCYENEYYKEFHKLFSREYHSMLLMIEKVYSDSEICKLARILD